MDLIGADRIAQNIRRGLIRATVNAGVSTAIQGGKLDENLISALRQEAASVIGENASQEIGKAFHSGEINKFTQLVAHAAVGCASGAVASGDCGSGALGAVVGEVTAEIQEQRIQDRLQRELSDGSITKEEENCKKTNSIRWNCVQRLFFANVVGHATVQSIAATAA